MLPTDAAAVAVVVPCIVVVEGEMERHEQAAEILLDAKTVR